MNVVMIFKYSKRFRFAPSFNQWPSFTIIFRQFWGSIMPNARISWHGDLFCNWIFAPLNLFQFQQKNELLIIKAKFNIKPKKLQIGYVFKFQQITMKKKSASEKTLKISPQLEFAVMGSTEKKVKVSLFPSLKKNLGNSLLNKI